MDTCDCIADPLNCKIGMHEWQLDDGGQLWLSHYNNLTVVNYCALVSDPEYGDYYNPVKAWVIERAK